MTFLLIVSLGVTSCNSKEASFKMFNSYQNEICSILLNENDDILKKKFDLPIKVAYYKYLEELSKVKTPDEIGKNIFIRNSTFYQKLTDAGFFSLNKVRIYPNEGNKNEKYYKLKYELNLKSEYLKFLNNVSKNNKIIEKYRDYLISSGDLLSPGAIKIILNDLNEDDLKNEDIRLIVGVHFLLINQ